MLVCEPLQGRQLANAVWQQYHWVCPLQLERISVLETSGTGKRLLSSTETLSSYKVTPIVLKLHYLLQTHGHASVARYVLATRL